MSNPLPPEKPLRDPGDSFVRMLFTWPNVLVVVVIILVVLIALFYAEENWRGQRAWKKYRNALEARGESVDLKAFIPAPVPAAENFASTPLVRAWFPRGGPQYDAYNGAAKMIPERAANLDKAERHFMDLGAWEMAFNALSSEEKISASQKFQSEQLDLASRAAAAPAVLNALTNIHETFDELREASQRPHSRYPINYDLQKPWGILLPHLAHLKHVCQMLELKACAELAVGHGENALEDVKLMLFLGDSLKDEPFLICYLVRLGCLRLALQPIWEGLAEHLWNDSQLQELEKLLSGYDIATDLKQKLRAERAFSILTIHSVGANRKLLYDVGIVSASSSAWENRVQDSFIHSIPQGWFYHEQANYCRLFDQQFGTFLSDTNRVIRPGEADKGNAAVEEVFTGGENLFIFHRAMASILLRSLGKSLLRSAQAQVSIDQARIACALERYRLANGNWPEKLEMLPPNFASQLPPDFLTGDSYKYRRDGAAFILYSVGWNEKDDGGIPGKKLFDEANGDWVWAYPRD